MTTLTWLSHGGWLIETRNHRVLLDPFLTDNPTAKANPSDFSDVSHILVSHGHFDHVGDSAAIAKQSGATIVASFEVAQWFTQKHNIESTTAMNIGGQVALPFARVKMVPALHSSSLPDGSYGGQPSGFVLSLEGKRIYFACDTALYSDMKLYAQGVDVAVLPIGDLYTMGIDDSIAAIERIQPQVVLPAHYQTWPPIAQDAQDWARRVKSETSARPMVLEVGESFAC